MIVDLELNGINLPLDDIPKLPKAFLKNLTQKPKLGTNLLKLGIIYVPKILSK